MKNLTKKVQKAKKPPNPEIKKRMSEIIAYLEKEKHTTVAMLAKIWKTTPQNIYQLRDGYREITVKQANILYQQFRIPHKKSQMDIGPMTESYYSESISLSEPESPYGTIDYKQRYQQAYSEIQLLKKTIEDKDKIINLLESK